MSASGERKTRQQRLPAPQRQRGAVAVFVAAGLVALIASLLLVLDIGRLYYAQRQLQLDANMAALAGAQAGSGCLETTDGIPGDPNKIKTVVLQSLQNNRTPNSLTDLGNPTEPQMSGDGSAFSILNLPGAEGSLKSEVEVGKVVLGDVSGTPVNTFKPLSVGDSSADAVRVTLVAAKPPSFLMHFFGSSSSSSQYLYASATAKQQALGSFYLGTGVLDLSGGLVNQVLGALLCAGDAECAQVVALNLASASGGLAAANVSLGQLATALNVSVKDLSDPVALSTHTPVLSDVLNGLAGSLSGTTSATVTGLLSSLATAVSGNRNTIPLGQLLGAIDDAAGNVPFVNLTSLISALGAAAQPRVDGQVQPIELQPAVTILGATVATFVKIGAPPQLGGPGPAGSTTAKTAEATVMVRISAGALLNGLKTSIVGIVNGLLGVLQALGVNSSVNVVPGPLNLGVDIAVAPATASLDKLQCPTAGSGPVASLSADPAIATVKVGTFTGDARDAPALGSSSQPDQADFPLADVNIDASKACIGIGLLGGCIGIPANLGKTNIALGLQLTSLAVGGSGNQSLPSDVDQFSFISSPSKAPPGYYLAKGAPSNLPVIPNENPQTVGSPVNAALTLDLTNTETGSGLIGALGHLVKELVTSVTGLVQPLLDVVKGLAASLINPLLQTLGIQLGSATVTMNTAVFNQPVIVTNCLPLTPEGNIGVNGNGCPEPDSP